MKFSVIIPVYNVSQFLRQCLDSVLAQTCSDFECIIVDDGSTDDSGSICDEYAEKDDRFKVIHKSNEGLISARRIGIDNAKGDFCVFVDSDDFVEPKLLQTVVESIESDVDMVIYSFRYYENGKYRERKTELFPDYTVFEGDNKTELYLRFINGNDVTAIWIKAIKTEILKSDPTDYRQYYRFNMSEDVLQSLYPLTEAKKVIYRKIPLVNYRINPNSVSRSFSPDTIKSKNTVHVYYEFLKYLPLWGLDTPEIRSSLNNRWFSLAMYTFCQYYESCKPSQRKEVVDFDWDSLIPADARNDSFLYDYEVYSNLYHWIKSKKYFRLSLFFFKKRINKLIKSIPKKYQLI